MCPKWLSFVFVLGVQVVIAQDTLQLDLIDKYGSYKESHFRDTTLFLQITHLGDLILENHPADSIASMYLHLAYYNRAVSLLKVVKESEDSGESMKLQNEAMHHFEESKKYYLLYKKPR